MLLVRLFIPFDILGIQGWFYMTSSYTFILNITSRFELIIWRPFCTSVDSSHLHINTCTPVLTCKDPLCWLSQTIRHRRVPFCCRDCLLVVSCQEFFMCITWRVWFVFKFEDRSKGIQILNLMKNDPRKAAKTTRLFKVFLGFGEQYQVHNAYTICSNSSYS